MNKELIISATPDGVHIALTEDGRLAELHKESPSSQFAVGDIFFGKVKKIMTGLNAAFVDLGGEKEGFMHYLDPKRRGSCTTSTSAPTTSPSTSTSASP